MPVTMPSRDGPELMLALIQTQMATQRDTTGIRRTFADSVSRGTIATAHIRTREESGNKMIHMYMRVSIHTHTQGLCVRDTESMKKKLQ